MAQKKKKSGIGGTIVFVLLVAAVIVGIYMSLTRDKNDGKLEANVEVTEVSTLLNKDIANDYPGTVREVMKLYCRITQCLYSGAVSDDEAGRLIDQIRLLYSDELLAQNDQNTMVGMALGEIKRYKAAGQTINSYSVAESGEIKYYREETPARAIINIYFTIKNDKDKTFDRAYEEFVLTEDENSHWKIVGWRMAED